MSHLFGATLERPQRGRWLALCLALALGLACGCAPLLETPPEFVSLDDARGDYDYRAVTPDGLVIGARKLDHKPQGDLNFWARAVENQLRKVNGYALLEARPVKTRSGLTGKQMRFGRDDNNHAYVYVVAVFVNDAHLYLVEAGGTKELVDANTSKIEQAIVSLHASP